MKLGPYSAYLQRRWGLASARAAGSLRNAFAGDYKAKKAPLLEIVRALEGLVRGGLADVCRRYGQ